MGILPSKIGTGQGPQSQGTQIARTSSVNVFTNAVGVQGPIGKNGRTGRRGSPGSSGASSVEMGYAGLQGLQGSQGIQGMQGEGEQGAVGAYGCAGWAGNQGIQGRQGWQGLVASGPGLQGQRGNYSGMQGSQGSQGAQGVQGWQGNQSPDGVQGAQGNQGSSSLGYVGVDGNQGNQGLQGYSTNGTQGIQGTFGPQAPTPGTVGYQGAQPSLGYTGFINSTGPQGSQGLQGRLSSKTMMFYDDFIGADIVGYETSGTVSVVTGAAYGVMKLLASSSTTAYIVRFTSTNNEEGLIDHLTEGVTAEFRVKFSTHGSSMSGIRVKIGLYNGTSGVALPENILTDISSGVYFDATYGTNDGDWTICSMDGSTYTKYNTTTTPTFSDGTNFSFQELKIIKNGTTFSLYIDDVLEEEVTSAYSSYALSPIVSITASGGFSRSCYIDYYYIEAQRA